MLKMHVLLQLSFAAWLLASVAGMSVLWTYEAAPGVAASPPVLRPQETRLQFNDSGPTMLVWLHPRCPCSRATVAELERLLADKPDDVHCQVILTRPADAEASFTQSPLANAVRRLDHVRVVVDAGQHEARRFGVATSGQVLLYDESARLQFAGGITSGRGHEGDNRGAAALQRIFRVYEVACQTGSQRDRAGGSEDDLRAAVSTCCVYGCELVGPSDRGLD